MIYDYDVDDKNSIIFNRVKATANICTEYYAGDFSKRVNVKMTQRDMENFVDRYYSEEYDAKYPNEIYYNEEHLLEIMDDIISSGSKDLDNWILEKGREMIMNGEFD